MSIRVKIALIASIIVVVSMLGLSVIKQIKRNFNIKP